MSGDSASQTAAADSESITATASRPVSQRLVLARNVIYAPISSASMSFPQSHSALAALSGSLWIALAASPGIRARLPRRFVWRRWSPYSVVFILVCY